MRVVTEQRSKGFGARSRAAVIPFCRDGGNFCRWIPLIGLTNGRLRSLGGVLAGFAECQAVSFCFCEMKVCR